jgi:hypothetical protein
MPQSYELFQVFGEWQSSNSPTYPTYVDRNGLDSEFAYLLKSSNLIVIHGESRQGKTVLWTKHLPVDKVIRVNCSVDMTAIDINKTILRKMNATTNRTQQITQGENSESTKNLGGGAKALGLSTQGNLEASESSMKEVSLTQNFVEEPLNNINGLADIWKDDRRVIVIDDFHYVASEEQRILASGLKGLTENGMQFVIVGVWEEANRLTAYNNQLRTKEINITWNDDELLEVLRLGEVALNIYISKEIKHSILRDANGSVGLLQIIAESLCKEAQILSNQEDLVKIENIKILDQARIRTCRQQFDTRFRQMLRTIAAGKNASQVRMYEKILQVLVTLSDKELLNGVKPGEITRKMETLNLTSGSKRNQGHVTQTLEKINALQNGSGDQQALSPLFYYDDGLRLLRLVDRTFLFYRKYTASKFPWEDVN